MESDLFFPMTIKLKYRFFFVVVVFFNGHTVAYGSSQAGGLIGVAAGQHHNHSNTESLTHRERPGM